MGCYVYIVCACTSIASGYNVILNEYHLSWMTLAIWFLVPRFKYQCALQKKRILEDCYCDL